MHHHDTEFVAEAEAIKQAKAGKDSDGEEELPEIVVVKQKVIEVEEDNMEEDKLKEELKQLKLAEGGLLQFAGAVSDLIDGEIGMY